MPAEYSNGVARQRAGCGLRIRPPPVLSGRIKREHYISSKQVEAAEIFVLSLAEQRRIVARVTELMILCDQSQTQLAAVRTDSVRLLNAVLRNALGSEAAA